MSLKYFCGHYDNADIGLGKTRFKDIENLLSYF